MSAQCVNSEQIFFPANWFSTYLKKNKQTTITTKNRCTLCAFPLCRRSPPSTFLLPRMPLSPGLLSLRHPPDLSTPSSGLYFFLVAPCSAPVEPLVTQTIYQASLHTSDWTIVETTQQSVANKPHPGYLVQQCWNFELFVFFNATRQPWLPRTGSPFPQINKSEIAGYFRAYWLLGDILLRSLSQLE